MTDSSPEGTISVNGPAPFHIVPTSMGRRLRRLVRRIVTRWRRSIQIRVVSSTLVVSAVVVALLGLIVLQQVKSGLLQAKIRSSTTQVLNSYDTAQQYLNEGSNISALLTAVNSLTVQQTRRQPGGYEVVGFIELTPGKPLTTQAAKNDDFDTSSVPAKLIDSVSSGDAQYYYEYTTMSYQTGAHYPGLAVGSRFTNSNSQHFQIYYVFSLQQEDQTLSLVWRTLLLSGLAIVVLLAGIAWLVTRQVVTPVRMAARIAERLADGRLQERMRPKGEDDLARLAASFNKMADSLQRQIRRLEDLSRIQRRFVSDVSHELRTPLTTVRMAADVLFEARQEFDPASARSAELLQTQLDRFESLLSDLLEISRHDAGAASLEPDALDIRDLVRHVVEATEPLATRRGSSVNLHLPEDPCICEADSRRVERILRNLLVNAAEHGEGEPIDVFVVGDADAVAVAVRDHGIGLRPGESSLVFNRFWRADPARARTTGGTGLGLSIASEDARLHGGRLQAWGERGKGSQFVLTVPRRVGAHFAQSPIALEPPDASTEPVAATGTTTQQPTRDRGASDLGIVGTLRGRRD
ncbi:MAG: MtrAB system histidine kinase MtrB [Acidothermaceae bacterium]